MRLRVVIIRRVFREVLGVLIDRPNQVLLSLRALLLLLLLSRHPFGFLLVAFDDAGQRLQRFKGICLRIDAV